MAKRVFSRTRSPRKRTSEFSSVSNRGMFESRPFVVQSKEGEEGEKLGLKISLMRAERYGHHFSQIQPLDVSVPTLQPKIGIEQPLHLQRVEALPMQLTRVRKRTKKRKPVSYFRSKSLRFARKKRSQNQNARTGINYATAKILVKDKEGNVIKTRYLTMQSGSPPKGVDSYKTGHSEKNILARVQQMNEDPKVKGNKTYEVASISSELEDCGKDNKNCNALVAKHKDTPKVRFGIPYPDRRDHPNDGKDHSEMNPEVRKKMRNNAMKKLRKAGTKVKNQGPNGNKTSKTTHIDSDFSDLEYDSVSSGTDTEYETDVEDSKANWNRTW